jgi:hypothetical protein
MIPIPSPAPSPAWSTAAILEVLQLPWNPENKNYMLKITEQQPGEACVLDYLGVYQLQSILLCLFQRWGSDKLFAQIGLEPQSSQSQPPK